MRIKIILLNVLLLIFLFVLIYLYLYINYNKSYENFTAESNVFLSSTNTNYQSNNIASNTVNANSTDPQQIDILESLPFNEDYMGLSPTNAFTYVNDIMCQNRIDILKKTGKKTYGNGYYWVNIPTIGAKLLYLITDEAIQSGGWVLAMRVTVGSSTYNLVYRFNYNEWLGTITTKKAKSQYILSLEINPTVRYNNELGINRYNEDLMLNFNTSSIGTKIYTPNKKYDCKFESFNNYMFKEIMVIFFKNEKEDSLNKLIAHIKIPNSQLDNVSTLNKTFKLPEDPTTITFNSFRTDKNMDLIYNFKMDVYNIQGGISTSSASSRSSLSTYTPPFCTFNCLLGVQGTIDARVENGVSIPRTRYIYGIGISNSNRAEEIIPSAVLIEIPDIITVDNATKRTNINYFPLGYELYIK